jgi:hypothetical protein
MHPLLQSLASIAAVIGPVVTLIGLIQSRGWLAAMGAIFACVSIIAVVYARSQRLRVDAASIEIEGISIDSLNAANLRRRVSRNFAIQTVHHIVTIEGADLEITWRYAGYCRADRATAFEFSVDSENSIPFARLDCFGYDLKCDPDKQHRIQPLLIGPDSISKKIAIPFHEPLLAQQPFDIVLNCRLPGTYEPGVAYYTSTLSFDQRTVGKCTVQLIFRGQKPEWVRVYECEAGGSPRLLRNLSPVREEPQSVEYMDVAEDRSAKSARVYLFRRGNARNGWNPFEIPGNARLKHELNHLES